MPLRLVSSESPSDEPDPVSGARGRDASWMERMRAGDEAAFEALFREHYHGLALFAARLVSSDAVAEELVQDVLLRMWQQRDRLVITESVSAYLYGAVRNQALAYLRHEKVVRRWKSHPADLGQTGQAPQADEAARGAELARAIERAVAALPPRTREAYLLRRQHHLSYGEIAQIMGTATKTVEIQIGAALKVLRAKLADWLAP
jgi:RNA polymerase sigma-19 factor, ECF subfamily